MSNQEKEVFKWDKQVFSINVEGEKTCPHVLVQDSVQIWLIVVVAGFSSLID